MAPKVTIAAGKLPLEDVCAVAAMGATVVVDAAAVDATAVAAATAAAAVDATPQEEEVSSSCSIAEYARLSTVATRALLVLMVHRLVRMRGSPAVYAHALYLVSLLNHGVLPVLPRDSPAMHVLSATHAAITGKVVTIQEALKEAAITRCPMALRTNEQALMENNAALLAECALLVGGARGLLPLADAVAALSCEALSASAACFDAEAIESARPHRGIVTSAAQLRGMLESSKYATAQGGAMATAAAVAHTPQYHGPARDAVLGAFKTVEVELNAAASASASGAVAIHPQVLETAHDTVMHAIQVLQRGSHTRWQLLVAQDTAVPRADEGKPQTETKTGAVVEAEALVRHATQALMREAELAMRWVDREAELARAKQAEKQVRAQEAASKAAAAAAKEDEKLAAMPEAQRLKVLEKRRKKQEKQREKDVAKQQAQGEQDGAALGLGVGSNAFYQYLVVLRNEGNDEAAEVASATATPWTARVTPFDLTGATSVGATGVSSAQDLPGVVPFLEALFVRLSSGGARRKPKLAKGAQDFVPMQMALREKIFNKIRMVFKRHAGVEIETPVFELKDTLTGKYGEDSKLIYDLADQGGELLALRYDLTVPFARFMALHNPGNIKRFHMARVYRRDNPQMARGRFREFYQCDFDIAGSYARMLPDAEVLAVAVEVLQQFPDALGPFKVKLSHRGLLDAIMAICGVPTDKFRATCSAIDKLDKEPWSEVRREMVDDKGLPEHVADAIEKFVCHVGEPRELHAQLMRDQVFGANAAAASAMEDLRLLFTYLEAMGVLPYVSFDLSLARGLDYYTGLIYEFVLTSPEHNVGSIAAGGRYDNLVGMFSATGQQIPCVGVSMGIERIFGILQAHEEKQRAAATTPVATTATQVLVAATGGGQGAASSLVPRLEVCQQLWRANISAEIMQLENPKFTKQLHYALETGIPFMVVLGEDELAAGVVKLKEMRSKEEVTVAREDLVAELLRRQCVTTDTLNV